MFTFKGFLVFLSVGAMALCWALPAEADTFNDYKYVKCLGKGVTSIVVEASKADGSHVALKLFRDEEQFKYEKQIVETISKLRKERRTPNFLEYLGSHAEMTGILPMEYQNGKCKNSSSPFMTEEPIGDYRVDGVIKYAVVRSIGNNWETNKCWDLMMVHAFLMFRKYLSFTHGDFTGKNLLPSEWPNDVKHMCFGYKSDTEEKLTYCVSKAECNIMPIIIDFGESSTSEKAEAPYIINNDYSGFRTALSELGRTELCKNDNNDLTKMILNDYFTSFKNQIPQGQEGEVVYYGD